MSSSSTLAKDLNLARHVQIHRIKRIVSQIVASRYLYQFVAATTYSRLSPVMALPINSYFVAGSLEMFYEIEIRNTKVFLPRQA